MARQVQASTDSPTGGTQEMSIEAPKPGSTVTGALFPEPVLVIVCTPLGASGTSLSTASTSDSICRSTRPTICRHRSPGSTISIRPATRGSTSAAT